MGVTLAIIFPNFRGTSRQKSSKIAINKESNRRGKYSSEGDPQTCSLRTVIRSSTQGNTASSEKLFFSEEIRIPYLPDQRGFRDK